MPDNKSPLDAASPGKQLGEIGEGLGKVADGVSKAVDAAEKAANAAVDNKNNRWPVIRFWVLMVVAIYIVYRVTVNGDTVKGIAQGKTDAATERLIQSLEATIKEQRLTIETRDATIVAKDAIMYGQDTTNRNLRMSLERANNLLLLKQNK